MASNSQSEQYDPEYNDEDSQQYDEEEGNQSQDNNEEYDDDGNGEENEQEGNQDGNSQTNNQSCDSNPDNESPKYIRLRGLPWSATHKEILDFLKNIKVINGAKGIHLVTSGWDGKNTGEAYVEVQSQQDVDKALKLNMVTLGHRYIEVFVAKSSEVKYALRKTGNHDNSYVVKLRGLPYTVTEQQIEEFFQGLEIKPDREGIVFVTDRRGRATGEAFVQFESQEDTEQALGRNREKIGHRYIETFRSSYAELKRSIGNNGRPGPYDIRDRGSNRGNRGNDFGGGNWGNNGFGLGSGNSLGFGNLPSLLNSGNFGNSFNNSNSNSGSGSGGGGGGGGGNFSSFASGRSFGGNSGNFGNSGGNSGNFGGNSGNFGGSSSNFGSNRDNGGNFGNFGGNNGGNFGGSGGGGNGSNFGSSNNRFGDFGNFGNNRGSGGGNGGNNGNSGGGGGNFNNYSTNGSFGNSNPSSFGNNYSSNMSSNGSNFGPIGGGRGDNSEYFTIHMRGLPYSSFENDVIKFFEPIRPANVKINYNNKGMHSGTADAFFETYEDIKEAMERHRAQMGNRYIELFFDGKTKMSSGGGNSGGNSGGGSVSSIVGSGSSFRRI